MATSWGSAAGNSALTTLVATYPWIQLHVGSPGAAGTTNVAVNSTRQQASSWAAASGGSIATSAALTWTNVAGSETYTNFSAWTASTAGTFGFSGTVTANPVTAGDTFTINSGSLTASVTLAS